MAFGDIESVVADAEDFELGLAKLDGGVVETDVGAVLDSLLVYRLDDEDLWGDELPFTLGDNGQCFMTDSR